MIWLGLFKKSGFYLNRRNQLLRLEQVTYVIFWDWIMSDLGSAEIVSLKVI